MCVLIPGNLYFLTDTDGGAGGAYSYSKRIWRLNWKDHPANKGFTDVVEGGVLLYVRAATQKEMDEYNSFLHLSIVLYEEHLYFIRSDRLVAL